MKRCLAWHIRILRALIGPAGAVAAGLLGAQPAHAQSPADKISPDQIRAATGAIDGTAIQANAATSKDWPAIGADYGETLYSKLAEINGSTIKDLGLVWSYNL